MTLLIYSIMVRAPEEYVPMLEMMWSTLSLRGCVRCDMLLIGNRECLSACRRLPRPACVDRLHALEVPAEPSLRDSLLRKLDIVDFVGLREYSQVLYLDCDIIVRNRLDRILHEASLEPSVLHATEENESFDHPFFGFGDYDLADLRRRGARTFNDGSFIFAPNDVTVGFSHS
jgi:hypothetical protein